MWLLEIRAYELSNAAYMRVSLFMKTKYHNLDRIKKITLLFNII